MNERPDAVFVAVRSEQDDPGLRPRDGEFNPASSLLEMLIGENAEAQLFGVELESPILVPHRNPQEFDSLNHVSQECQHAANRNQLPTIKSRNRCYSIHYQSLVEIDPYVTDTLMRDLVAHSRSAAAFLVYL